MENSYFLGYCPLLCLDFETKRRVSKCVLSKSDKASQALVQLKYEKCTCARILSVLDILFFAQEKKNDT